MKQFEKITMVEKWYSGGSGDMIKSDSLGNILYILAMIPFFGALIILSYLCFRNKKTYFKEVKTIGDAKIS